MNPVVLSALFGLVKGVADPGQPKSDTDAFQANVMAPVFEEAMYRALPSLSFGDRHTRGLSALVFATDHVAQEHRRDGLRGRHAVLRFADVFAGGLMYEAAYRRWGFFGAVLAHAAHNVMYGLGSKARGARAQSLAPAHRLHRLRVKRG